MPPLALITGLGVVSPIGVGVEPFRAALGGGRSAIAPIEGLELGARGPRLAARVAEVPARDHLSAALLRRMDRLAKMMSTAAAMAAENAGLVVRRPGEPAPLAADPRSLPAEDVAVVAGSALGNLSESAQFLEKVFAKGPALANPMLFPNTVMNAAASQLAIAFGWRGPNLTVSAGEISGEAAVEAAVNLLTTGRAPAVVVVAGDELSAILLRAWSDLGLLAPRRRDREWSSPFDRAADGVVAGEGAAALVLEPVTTTGKRAYAAIERVERGGMQAAPHAWARPRQPIPFAVAPDLVVSAADSSPERDACELALAAGATAKGARLTSLKSATGEYGSTGITSVVAAALAVSSGVAPALTALEKPIDGKVEFVRTPARTTIERAAVIGSARGGGYAVLELARVR